MHLPARVRVWGRPQGRGFCAAVRVGAGPWTNKQYGFSCKPTTLTAPPSDENYYLFRTDYNKWCKGPLDPDEKGPRGTSINPEGRLNPPDIWAAMFDLYEHNLRQELGEDESGVKDLRGRLNWVSGSKKYYGFGEKHPTLAGTADGTRSDADRRVEVLLFDEKEAPNLTAGNGDEIYDTNVYEAERLPPMVSARRPKTQPMRLRIVDPLMQPFENARCLVQIDRKTLFDANAPSDGTITVEVPRSGVLMDITVRFPSNSGSQDFHWQAEAISLSDVNTIDGCLIRLRNLGWYNGDQFATLDAVATESIKRFQCQWPELTANGQLDVLTRSRIRLLHDEP